MRYSTYRRFCAVLTSSSHRLAALDGHLVEQITRVGELLRNEQHVTNVHYQTTIQGSIINIITAQAFVVAVKSQADNLAAPVQHGATRIATRDVVGCQESDGHVFQTRINIAAEIFLRVQLFQ